MTTHHVLFVAAALFLGAGLYGAFSAPLDAPQGVTWLALGATLIATVTAAVVAVRFAIHAWRRRTTDDMPRRSVVVSLGVLGVCLGVAAIVASVVAHVTTREEPAEIATLHAPQDTTGATVTLTASPVPEDPADLSHLVFALAFSAGVAILAALTLAFLRVSDRDEAGEASSAPAA